MSLDGVTADAENAEVFYFKETISFNEIRERESIVWETAILYKFYLRLDKPCNIHVYLPFSLQGPVEWKQENMRSEEYQTKVAKATKFESVRDDIFRVGFYEELGEFTALMPFDEEMERITLIISGKKDGNYSKITINIPDLNLPEDFFQTNECGFGFMFKIKTREFLTKEIMEKLMKRGQIWNFNVKIYPVTSSLTKEEQNKLINLHGADIWVILPEDCTVFHLNPSPRVVMMMEKEDEELETTYASITGPYKTYRAGQIAICWDLENSKKEQMMHYIGTSSGIEWEIDEILRKMEYLNDSLKDLESKFRSSEEKTGQDLQEVFESLNERFENYIKTTEDRTRETNKKLDILSINFQNLLESIPKQYVTNREILVISLTTIGLIIATILSK